MEALLDREKLAAIDAVNPQRANEILSDMIAEVGVKNHVRVIVHRAKQQGKRIGHDGGTLVHDSRFDKGEQVVRPAHFAMLDSVRMLHGLKPIWLPEAFRRYGSELVSVTPNLRTAVGIDYVSSALGDSSGSRAAVAQYIALSNSTGTLATTDTSTTTGATGTGINWGTANATDAAAANTRGEYTALGVARALATYAHTAGTSQTSYTMTKQFTATATVTALQVCGLFNSASQGAGTLFVENNFTATSLATNDQLTIAWTLNI